jgi:hypothetical protein
MAQSGHATPASASRYQHATAERRRAIALSLGLFQCRQPAPTVEVFVDPRGALPPREHR